MEIVSYLILAQSIQSSHEFECGHSTVGRPAVPFQVGSLSNAALVSDASQYVVSGRVHVDPRPIINHVADGGGAKYEPHVVFAAFCRRVEAPIFSLQSPDPVGKRVRIQPRQVVS